MKKPFTPHDYKFAKALQESLAADVENKKDLFKNPEDIETAKKIIRGQVWQNMNAMQHAKHQ